MRYAPPVLQAVLPYFGIPDGHIGPIPIHPFGLLVGVGIVLGYQFAVQRSRRLGLPSETFERLVFWTVLTGIVLSHVLDTVFYHPALLKRNPFELVLIWHGLSSFGGFLGAAIGFFVYSRRHKVDAWRSADAIAYGLPVGWLFGRMGCAVVHDHPGLASSSPFAMWFAARPQIGLPAGSYFDLGLLELMCTPILIVATLIVASRTRRPGSAIATLALVYPLIRFPLDYLRQPDPSGGDLRYAGLTPAQYACIACFLFGVYALRHVRSVPALADGA